MKTQLTLVVNIEVEYRKTPQEIGTTDELNRSEVIPEDIEILAVIAQSPDGKKAVNITDILDYQEIEYLSEMARREEGLCL